MKFKDLRSVLLEGQRLEITFWAKLDEEEAYYDYKTDTIYDIFYEDLGPETWFENYEVLFVEAEDFTSAKLSIGIIDERGWR